MYRNVAAGKTRLCDIIVELTARYSALRNGPDLTQVEQWLLGTGRDAYICMKKGAIAHYHQKQGQNRWCEAPRQMTVVALWVNVNAMSTDSFVELV